MDNLSYERLGMLLNIDVQNVLLNNMFHVNMKMQLYGMKELLIIVYENQ